MLLSFSPWCFMANQKYVSRARMADVELKSPEIYYEPVDQTGLHSTSDSINQFTFIISLFPNFVLFCYLLSPQGQLHRETFIKVMMTWHDQHQTGLHSSDSINQFTFIITLLPIFLHFWTLLWVTLTSDHERNHRINSVKCEWKEVIESALAQLSLGNEETHYHQCLNQICGEICDCESLKFHEKSW